MNNITLPEVEFPRSWADIRDNRIKSIRALRSDTWINRQCFSDLFDPIGRTGDVEMACAVGVMAAELLGLDSREKQLAAEGAGRDVYDEVGVMVGIPPEVSYQSDTFSVDKIWKMNDRDGKEFRDIATELERQWNLTGSIDLV